MFQMEWGWIDLGKLLLAYVLGLIAGFNRAVHHKPAGVTTMSIVCMTASLTIQVSYKLAAKGLGPGADPERIASAIMTGVGFLGGSVILLRGQKIHGVTTAATIWIMSAIGLAIGAGYYVPALAAFGLLYLGVTISPWMDKLVDERAKQLGISQDNEDYKE